jgi:3-hydroxyacyl-CoA dehydrogenase
MHVIPGSETADRGPYPSTHSGDFSNMSKPIRRVGVIGAGVMGSGIASHFANAGIEVLMLDIVPPNLTEEEKKSRAKRNSWAAGGLDKALKSRPASFFHPDIVRLVTVGNTEDDLAKLNDCDLIIEAIIEKLSIKRSLFEKLDATLDGDTVVASNTSGLRIEDMLEGRSERFKSHFLVMHFFNPVRYMKLLELVVGPATDPKTLQRIKDFGRNQLGKGIVVGKDTPNFVGNRIGTHAMLYTMHQMLAQGLTPEDIDAITGEPMGHPKSASLRTGDIVGLDTFAHVADNCYAELENDPQRDVFKVPEFVRKMVELKYLGDKTKGGFYKKTKDGILTLDPGTLEYRAKGGSEDIKKLCKKLSGIEDVRERVRQLVADQGPAGKFAWSVLATSMGYSATMIPEISDEVEAIDNAMKWGYNWELGPFETWDALGFKATAERLKAEGYSLPASIDTMLAAGAESFYTNDGRVWDLTKGAYVARDLDPREITLAQMRQGGAPVYKNKSLEAWDIGDGVLCMTFTSKSNSIDSNIINGIPEVIDIAERDFQALLLFNEGPHFCVGANLFEVVMAAKAGKWDDLESMVANFQAAVQRMKYSTIPVVSAPFGMTVGGGCELCLASDTVQAYSESYVGLVEVGVGLLPGGAGNLNLLWRSLSGIPEGATVEPIHLVAKTFENIAMAKVATSAVEAQRVGYFRSTDGVSFDKARHLYEAKQRAVGLAKSGYHPPAPRAFRLPGESGIATVQMMIDTLRNGGFASDHDALISRKVAEVLCGGPAGNTREITEAELLTLERKAFVALCKEPKSQARMEHMLMKNAPLRN